jgi:transglutaminase-like putative cysteine protease
MNLQITHETRYDYSPVVEVAQHLCHLRPNQNTGQTLLSHNLRITPQPDAQSQSSDVFGNTVSYFSLQSAHSQLVVTAQSTVATRPPLMPTSAVTCAQVRERFRYAAGAAYDPAAEFLFASPFVPRHADFVAYARASLLPDAPLHLAARDLMRRIYTDFLYESQSTEVNTPALTALAQRKGVCQDFAHIMIACLRSFGVPARYVSGYLMTTPPPGVAPLRGSDASHAWVSVYLPDLPDLQGTHGFDGSAQNQRWFDYDPTNNREGWGSPGEDYVSLAVGRDFGDVSPLRGIIHGGADHVLNVGVTVEAGRPESGMSQSQSQSQSQLQSQSQPQFQSDSQFPSQFQSLF